MEPQQQDAGGRGRAKDRLGRYGEDLAAQHLVAAGMRLLDRNWRCREGELDLVARDRDGTLVFVEDTKERWSARGAVLSDPRGTVRPWTSTSGFSGPSCASGG